MSLEQTVNINDNTYKITPHPPEELGKLPLKIAALMSGPILTLLKNADSIQKMQDLGELDLGEIDAKEVQELLFNIVDRISEDEIRMLFNHTQRGKKHLSDDMAYSQAFQGNISEWYKALQKILQVNGFLDFLS